jgi:predicted dinucleotide-binding enzyme
MKVRQPTKNDGRCVISVSGDHPEPTEFVRSVIESFGFVPVYLGGLAAGGRLQQAGGPLAGRDLVDSPASELIRSRRRVVGRLRLRAEISTEAPSVG